MERAGFYGKHGNHGCFSSFSNHSFKLKGHTWSTVEHYFQAQKFTGTQHEGKVRKAKGPGKAKQMGNDRKRPLRKDWESVKENVMYDALKAKFTQHKYCKEDLLRTGDKKIVEESPTDYYWGEGASGKGKNRLGVLLMRLRDELKNVTN